MSVADLPGALRSRQGAPISRRDRIRLLEAENERLRALLEMEVAYDEDSWGKHATQEMRDQYAAAAYAAEGLHPFQALTRLGFKLGSDSYGHFENPEDKKRARALCKRIFETPGVQAILHADAAKFAPNKEAVIGGMIGISLNPLASNADRVRATSQASKMLEGWQDGEKVKNPALALNFLTQIVGSAAVGASASGARVSPLELPPGGDTVIDAEEFFVERDAEVAVVIDDPQDTRKLTR